MGLFDKFKDKLQQPQGPGGYGGGYGQGGGGYPGGQGGYGGQGAGGYPASPGAYGQQSQSSPAFPSSPAPHGSYAGSGAGGDRKDGDDRPLPEGWVKQWDAK